MPWTIRDSVALIALLGGASSASAQAEGPPDPATITLPDMTPPRDPADIRDGANFFYFHKAGVSYAEAYADFSLCYRYQPSSWPINGADAALPMFTPWNATPGATHTPLASPYGLVGDVILALFSGPVERRDRQARMRRCMEPRGYVRYPLTEAVWTQLIDHYSLNSIAMQAKAASGPTPNSEPVTR